MASSHTYTPILMIDTFSAALRFHLLSCLYREERHLSIDISARLVRSIESLYCAYDGFETCVIYLPSHSTSQFLVAARTQNASDIARVSSTDALDVEIEWNIKYNKHKRVSVDTVRPDCVYMENVDAYEYRNAATIWNRCKAWHYAQMSCDARVHQRHLFKLKKCRSRVILMLSPETGSPTNKTTTSMFRGWHPWQRSWGLIWFHTRDARRVCRSQDDHAYMARAFPIHTFRQADPLNRARVRAVRCVPSHDGAPRAARQP